jgi:hypothetical protein
VRVLHPKLTPILLAVAAIFVVSISAAQTQKLKRHKRATNPPPKARSDFLDVEYDKFKDERSFTAVLQPSPDVIVLFGKRCSGKKGCIGPNQSQNFSISISTTSPRDVSNYLNRVRPLLSIIDGERVELGNMECFRAVVYRDAPGSELQWYMVLSPDEVRSIANASTAEFQLVEWEFSLSERQRGVLRELLDHTGIP